MNYAHTHRVKSMNYVTKLINTLRTLPPQYGWVNHLETETVKNLELGTEESPLEKPPHDDT